MTKSTEYTLDNAWQRARERLSALEALYDPGTVRHLEARGVGEGWRCLDVGAGGGSTAAWLCGRVGPAGRLLATDIDPRFLGALALPNLEVCRHDVAAEELPSSEFDLVHTRLVPMHLRHRETALRRLAASLRPGGWLVAEEGDFVSSVPVPTVDPESARLFVRVQEACLRFSARRGADYMYGRRLAADLAGQGLVEVGAEGRVYVARGGSASVLPHSMWLGQLRGPVVEAGSTRWPAAAARA